MTPEQLAEIRDRVTYNPEDWPITIELVAHIDTITAENDRLKGEVERLERLNTSLRYDHDLFKLAALRIEDSLRSQLSALVTAGEAADSFIRKVQAIMENHLRPDGPNDASTITELYLTLDGPEQRQVQDALAAAVTQAKGGL